MATAAQESTRITVTLCWSVSGNVFKEVVCTTEEWGTIIRGDKEEWSYVPTRKLHVVRADGNILLEGLFLAAGKDRPSGSKVIPNSTTRSISQNL